MISLSFIVTIIVDFFSLVLVNNGNKFEEQAPEYCIIYLYCNVTVFINLLKFLKLRTNYRNSDAAEGFTEGWGRSGHGNERAHRVREWVRRIDHSPSQ